MAGERLQPGSFARGIGDHEGLDTRRRCVESFRIMEFAGVGVSQFLDSAGRVPAWVNNSTVVQAGVRLG
jgi:hypothetical protein